MGSVKHGSRGQFALDFPEVRKIYSGEIYASCCFENRSEYFGSSNAVCHGTMEEVIAWFADDNNVEAIAMMLQDLYENTRTWD